MPKKFLNVNEVAKLLGVTPLTIRNWDQKGKLTAYRHPMNNYRLYKVEDVENILKDIDQSKGIKPIVHKSSSQPRKLKISTG